MITIGIDASTNRTGLSVFQEATLLSHQTIDHHDIKDVDERIKHMIQSICHFLTKEKPDVVYIEDTWNAKNIETTKKLSYIIGSVMTYCYLKNVAFNKVEPSTWRSHVGLSTGKKKRSELKQDAINFVREKYGFEPQEDEAEAILIGLSGVLEFGELFE